MPHEKLNFFNSDRNPAAFYSMPDESFFFLKKNKKGRTLKNRSHLSVFTRDKFILRKTIKLKYFLARTVCATIVSPLTKKILILICLS